MKVKTDIKAGQTGTINNNGTGSQAIGFGNIGGSGNSGNQGIDNG